MIPLKEALEVTDSAPTQGSSNPTTDTGQLRSDAVSLDVPVKIHGSRVTEVVLGVTPHTEPFEEHTSTMIVFPVGGVLRMSTPVSAGQAIVVTNLKSGQDAICRVVKVRTNPNLHSYVEIEFTHPQPGYWGVHFPSDGPLPTKKVTPPRTVALPAAASATPPPTIRPGAAEGRIVHEASGLASSTRPATATNAMPLSMAPVAVPVEFPRKVGGTGHSGRPPAPEESFSMAQLRGALPVTTAESSAVLETEEDARELTDKPSGFTPKEFAEGHGLAGRSPAAATFGSRLQYGAHSEAESTGEVAGEGRKSVHVVSGIVALIAIFGAGIAYFRLHTPLQRPVAVTAPPAPALPFQASANENAPSIASTSTHGSPGAAPSAPVAAAASRIVVHANDQANAKQSKPSKSAENEPSAATGPEKPKAHTAVPDMFGVLNAHPVSSQRSGQTSSTAQTEAAPIIGTEPADAANPLPLGNPAVSLGPVPQPEPDGPVPVGGEVPVPRTIVSSMPSYPQIARDANAQGNVVVRIVIDKSGRVVQSKAVSGPVLLRQAAEEALLKRKYEPSKLKGQPVSVEMLVTIQFHL
jgi:periplasmic protein TonB